MSEINSFLHYTLILTKINIRRSKMYGYLMKFDGLTFLLLFSLPIMQKERLPKGSLSFKDKY